MRKLAAILALVFAFTGIGGAASAAPAEAATVIRGMYVDSTYWGVGHTGIYYRHLPARYYWVDYNWWEERTGKRDCYCHMVPLLTR